MHALITNIINNMFHAIWFCILVPEPKYSRKKTVLIVSGTTVAYQLISMALMYIRHTDILPYEKVGISSTYFIGFLLGLLLYSAMFVFGLSASRPAKSLFLVSAYYSMWAIIYSTTSIVTGTYTGAGNAVIWGLRIGLNLLFLIPFLVFRDYLFQIYREVKIGYWLITTLSILCFFMQCLLLFYNDKVRDHSPLFKLLMLFSFVFMVAVYAMIMVFMAQSNRAYRLKQFELNERFLQAQIASYEKMAENARLTRHDFRHHNMVVMEYARNKDYQGILSYLQEYEERETEKYIGSFCKNHAIDTVLSAYVSRCEQSGIEINTDIRLENIDGISDYDLVSILANILENAVNGCLKAEGKGRIEISVRQKERKLILVCKNTCIPDILFEDDRPQNRGRDGVGVESILKSAEKYGGNVDFSASNGVFSCRVLLNNKSEQMQSVP